MGSKLTMMSVNRHIMFVIDNFFSEWFTHRKGFKTRITKSSFVNTNSESGICFGNAHTAPVSKVVIDTSVYAFKVGVC